MPLHPILLVLVLLLLLLLLLLLTSPLLLLCSEPLSQKLWSVESGRALLRISAKLGPPSGPDSRDSSEEGRH